MTCREAMGSPEKENWLQAIQEECGAVTRARHSKKQKTRKKTNEYSSKSASLMTASDIRQNLSCEDLKELNMEKQRHRLANRPHSATRTPKPCSMGWNSIVLDDVTVFLNPEVDEDVCMLLQSGDDR